MASDALIPVGLAARRAGLSSQRIRQLCDSGVIDHVRDASGNRLILADALERFLRRREEHQRGRRPLRQTSSG